MRESQQNSVLEDGFTLPVRFKNIRMRQLCRRRTVHGFYREAYLVLVNEELYVYDSKDQAFHEMLIILTPGVLVKALPILNLEDQHPSQLYPV